MNSEQSRQTLYNCDRCRDSGDIEKRNCFWFGDEVQEVRTIQKVEDMHGNKILDKGEGRSVTSDTFLEIVGETVQAHEKLSCLDVCRAVFPAVCPKSLIVDGIDDLLSMESFCRDYNLPPLGREIGYLDYPSILVETFGVIGVARERVRAKEMKSFEAKHGLGSKT